MRRIYTITKVIPITKRVKFIDNYKFVKVVLDHDFKTFVIYMATLNILLELAKIKIQLF